MTTSKFTPRLANIRLHPIKSLDPHFVDEARIGANGGLELDRVWALYSADNRWVNGKRTAAMHLIRSEYAPDISSVTLTVPGDRRNIPPMTFAFPSDTEGASLWFSMYFEQPIQVRYTPEGEPDDGLAPGPTIVSRASLEAVCEWFPGMPLDEARRRFRTTLEIGDPATGEAENAERDRAAPRSTNGNRGGALKLPAFWEDQLFAETAESMVRFKIGDIAFEGSNPCARCPVPSRDTYTGTADAGFQKRFTELRRAQLPAWSPVERFDHFYRLAVNTRVPGTERRKVLRVGDLLILW